MLTERPTLEMIEAWISGTLPDDVAEMMEDYFTRHPEHLPNHDESIAHLSELDQETPDDPALRSLMDELNQRPSIPEAPTDPVLDLLQPTDIPGCLGTLAHYQVTEVIATTGMAMLWKAHDPKLDRDVAIKVLSPALAANRTARRRFEQEARAMAALEHEHILPIYEVQNDAPPWFAMRFSQGGSLQESLDQHSTSLTTPDFLESLLRQMALALHCAHQAGIIHRDLKPANILCSKKQDRFWLTDFGIARVSENPDLTYGNAVIGTPRYMSPEQARGEKIDPSSDLFSLGSVLFHLASGEPPFPGETSTSILHQLDTRTAPQLRKKATNLPPWLAQIIDRLLQKEPEKRFQSAAQLLKAIDDKKTTHPIPWLAILIPSLIVLSFLFWPETKREIELPASPASQSKPNTEATVTIKETGQQFHDLAEAISESPDQATLILRGKFILTSAIVTRKNRDLHLQAAEGTTPHITFRHAGKYGILIYGNGKASGINFISEHQQSQFHPFITVGGEICSVRHCQFLSRNPNKIVWAVAAKATKRLEVRSCVFRGEKLFATLLYDTHDGETPQAGSLLMSDCALACRGGIFCRSRDGDTHYRLEVENTRFKGLLFIETSKYNPFRPTHLSLTNCQLDYKAGLFQIAQGEPGMIRKNLKWQGKDNRYPENLALLKIRRPTPSKYETHQELNLFLENHHERGMKALTKKSSSEGTFEQFLRRISDGAKAHFKEEK